MRCWSVLHAVPGRYGGASSSLPSCRSRRNQSSWRTRSRKGTCSSGAVDWSDLVAARARVWRAPARWSPRGSPGVAQSAIAPQLRRIATRWARPRAPVTCSAMRRSRATVSRETYSAPATASMVCPREIILTMSSCRGLSGRSPQGCQLAAAACRNVSGSVQFVVTGLLPGREGGFGGGLGREACGHGVRKWGEEAVPQESACAAG